MNPLVDPPENEIIPGSSIRYMFFMSFRQSRAVQVSLAWVPNHVLAIRIQKSIWLGWQLDHLLVVHNALNQEVPVSRHTLESGVPILDFAGVLSDQLHRLLKLLLD
jgi:hypothetical protein